MVLRGPYRLAVVLLVFLLVNLFVVYFFSHHQLEQGNSYAQQLSAKSFLITSLQQELKQTKYEVENLKQRLQRTQAPSAEGHRDLPTIYIITPTYKRWTQKADLVRMCMTLMHVPSVHWIIVEDSDHQTRLVNRLLSGLESCKIGKSTQLNVRTPEQLRLSENEPSWRKNRGVDQRNLAIEWLRQRRADSDLNGRGVVYFGDDDNTYDPVLFEEMRYTVNVSVWLVGITGGLRFEGPLCKNGHVTGWYAEWGTSRTFPLDMAGFGINLDLLISNPTAYIDIKALRGNLESSLLGHLTTREELEGRPSDCKKVMVWHTRTEKPKMKQEDKLVRQGKPSDPHIEV